MKFEVSGALEVHQLSPICSHWRLDFYVLVRIHHVHFLYQISCIAWNIECCVRMWSILLILYDNSYALPFLPSSFLVIPSQMTAPEQKLTNPIPWSVNQNDRVSRRHDVNDGESTCDYPNAIESEYVAEPFRLIHVPIWNVPLLNPYLFMVFVALLTSNVNIITSSYPMNITLKSIKSLFMAIKSSWCSIQSLYKDPSLPFNFHSIPIIPLNFHEVLC